MTDPISPEHIPLRMWNVDGGVWGCGDFWGVSSTSERAGNFFQAAISSMDDLKVMSSRKRLGIRMQREMTPRSGDAQALMPCKFIGQITIVREERKIPDSLAVVGMAGMVLVNTRIYQCVAPDLTCTHAVWGEARERGALEMRHLCLMALETCNFHLGSRFTAKSTLSFASPFFPLEKKKEKNASPAILNTLEL
jgi:hypothetical protein